VSTTTSLTVSPVPGSTRSIAYIQSAHYTGDNAVSTVSTTLSKASTAGNTLIVAVSWGDLDAPMLSASDNAGNTYQVAKRAFDTGTRQGLAVLFAVNAKGGATTSTVSFGASVGYRRLVTLEYSGISSLDVTASNIGIAPTTQNGVTSKPATTTVGGELVFGVVMDDSGQFGSITAGTGFTQRAYTNNKDLACQDTIQAQAGSIASTQTFSKRDSYVALMATFK